MKTQMQGVPNLLSLDKYRILLAEMVAETSYLPDAHTVALFNRAIFPTIRNSKDRGNHVEKDGKIVGMYDDNTTPRWAFLWAHGISQTDHPKGWTFAHVWPSQDDLKSYTNLANIAMIPECFGTLTDKEGPLTPFLQWHSYQVYNWKPEKAKRPEKPDGYDTITWSYLPGIVDSTKFIRQRCAELNNQRIITLRKITGKSTVL